MEFYQTCLGSIRGKIHQRILRLVGVRVFQMASIYLWRQSRKASTSGKPILLTDLTHERTTPTLFLGRILKLLRQNCERQIFARVGSGVLHGSEFFSVSVLYIRGNLIKFV